MNNTEYEGISQAKQKKNKLPIFARVFFAMGGVSLVLYISFLCSESFSDFFNRYISSVFRATLAYATRFIPFSFAEFILLMSPFIFIAAVVYGTKKYADTWRDVFIYCGTLLSVIALVLSMFTIGFAPAYRGKGLDEKLGITRRKVSAQELYTTALILAERIDEEKDNITFDAASGFSAMPYNYSDMNDLLIEAYDKACDKYPFVQRLDSRIKPVMLSELMSYTHITGVYSFFTGEANINVAFPDYTIPFTAAHELSHQRGIAREDEANFMAYLVCIESDDPYIRYSGYMQLYEYVANALYSASSSLYYDIVYDHLPAAAYSEIRAYNAFFDKYADSTASQISGAVNNTFLTIQGTEGTRSYGMVVDLAVAYYVPVTK